MKFSSESSDKASAEVRHTLEAIYKQMLSAIERNDQTALINCFADDAILRSSDGETFAGRKEIAKYFEKMFAPGVTNKLAIQMDEVERHGDIAFEAGRHSWTVEEQGKNETEKGSYILIWKHQSSGTWKIYREIYTRSP